MDEWIMFYMIFCKFFGLMRKKWYYANKRCIDKNVKATVFFK